MIIGVLLGFVIACKPGTPKQYIQPKKMEDILVDYHLSKAMSQYANNSGSSRDYNQALYLEAVLKKHGVTKAQFDSSLVYYYTRADRFQPIYKRVSERLEAQALNMGASEGEIGKYANARGDTANIWSDRSSLLMLPVAPYNRLDFEIFGDSVFKRGDKFLFQFMSDFMYQSGQKSGMIYVAIDYADTTMVRNQRFTNSGITKMEFQAREDQVVKALRGYLYLLDGGEDMTSSQLLFLNNIQLIRFHKQDEKKEDSLPPTNNGGPMLEDDSRRDSLRRGDHMVSID